VYADLKGNRYISVGEISATLGLRVEEVVQALAQLQKRGRAISKDANNGYHNGFVMWKKPIKKFKKMRTGEWKKRIVEVLDALNGASVGHATILNMLKVNYPDAEHGRVGSALDALLKDGKFKRIHRREDGGKYVYWTTPITQGEDKQ
jgi:hypothetical protein